MTKILNRFVTVYGMSGVAILVAAAAAFGASLVFVFLDKTGLRKPFILLDVYIAAGIGLLFVNLAWRRRGPQ